MRQSYQLCMHIRIARSCLRSWQSFMDRSLCGLFDDFYIFEDIETIPSTVETTVLEFAKCILLFYYFYV